jgi:plasmid maintenance system antidote protein VapI
MTHMDIIDRYLITNGLRCYQLDNLIGTSRGTVAKLVSGEITMTPKVAFRIEQATGLDAADLLSRQARWTIEKLKGIQNKQSQHPFVKLMQKQSDSTAAEAWNAAIDEALALATTDGKPIIAKAKIETLIYNGETQ